MSYGSRTTTPFVFLPTLVAAFALAIAPGCGGPSAPPVAPEAPAVSASVPVSSPAPPAPLPSAAHHPAAELDPALATARAPEAFQAEFTTTKGQFVIEVHRSWAPNGADRFYNLVKMGFYDDTRFFRAIPDFMVQFGIPGDPQVAAKWRDASIPDDPVKQQNLRAFVTFAQTGRPNSRTTQIFICFENHPSLDASGFAPFGQVVRGMEVVDSLYKGYGEGAPNGSGPAQDRIQTEGNAYLDENFPKLDRILSTRLVAP
jgi:peptidyl-prolyl cis-trans isomerase A (cyclophilin A)